MSTVSVIVPCYNAERFISSTINSVLNQEFFDWELILVDDGSTDNTWNIITQYTKVDHRISGFSKRNEGPASARNYGFEKATTSTLFIFFLDSDDELVPCALSKLCEYMYSHPDVGLLACQFRNLMDDGQKVDSGSRSRWVPGTLLPRVLKDEEFETPFITFFCATGQGPFAIFRRSVFQKTDGWEPSLWFHEDTDIYCQMSLISKVHFLPDRLYLKRCHSAQMTNNTSKMWNSYSNFRAKWDNRQPRNEGERAILKRARKYYYTVHKPLRDLKVARKALAEFLYKPAMGRFKWFLYLTEAAIKGFFLARFKKY